MDTKRTFKYIQILVLYLLKIFPHKIIFKTQKNIETSIPEFHHSFDRIFHAQSFIKKSEFSPGNERKRISLQDNVPIIFHIWQFKMRTHWFSTVYF